MWSSVLPLTMFSSFRSSLTGRTPRTLCTGCLGSVVTGTDALIQCTAQEDCRVDQSQTGTSTQLARSAGSSGAISGGFTLALFNGITRMVLPPAGEAAVSSPFTRASALPGFCSICLI